MSPAKSAPFARPLLRRSRRVERLHIVAGEAALLYARSQDACAHSSEVFGVHGDDLPKVAVRFFKEWKEQRKFIEQLDPKSFAYEHPGGDATSDVDGVRVVVMEIDGISNR